MIACKALQKTYRNKQALKDITLHIEGEKITGLVGRNGAGKSTLLKVLAGYYKPTAGEAKIFGETPFNNLQVAANCILIEDTMSFPSGLTLQNIFKYAQNFYPNFQLQLAEQLLAYARISGKNFYQSLSKGEGATFRLIYGLATRCAVTLLDEPMNGMDEAIRTDFYRAILKEYIAYPRIIMISSHYVNEMAHLLEDLVLIDEGKVVMYESVDEIQSYAIKLVAKKELLQPFLAKANVLTEYYEGPIHEAVVVASTVDVYRLQQAGIATVPVSIGEVCKYLTTKSQGGIDDVFK